MPQLLFAAAIALSALIGCASFNQLSSEVSTYGAWPAERKPSSYAFERLPSQQAHPERQQMLEDAAHGALEAAGFRAAADAGSAEYLLQIGARVTSNDPWIYNDALFWRGGYHPFYGPGFGHGGWRRGWGPAWGWGPPYARPTRFEHEIALLIRDRKTGALLYEARATSASVSASIDPVLPAMFQAALQGFPRSGPNPRNVTVQLSQR